jgi:hypothetical protein
MTSRHLDNEQRRVLESLSSHPIPSNLKWPHVLSLLEAMGDVTVESKDRYRATVDGRTEVFYAPHHADVPHEMVVKLRKFLNADSPESPE